MTVIKYGNMIGLCLYDVLHMRTELIILVPNPVSALCSMSFNALAFCKRLMSNG